MNVVFNMDDAGQILRRRGLQPNGYVQKVFTNECVRAMEPYVPVRNHILRRVKSVRADSVTYLSPYARYHYYGKLMISSLTGSSYAKKGEKKILTDKDLVYHGGLTGPFWDKRMWADNKRKIMHVVARKAGGTEK